MRYFRINRRLLPRPRGPVAVRPHLELLEGRTLLSVNVQFTTNGLNANQSSCGCYPPDPDVAAGTDYVVGTVNTALVVYDKHTGQQLYSEPIRTFFAPISPGAFLSDVVVTYDDLAGRFIVGTLDIGTSSQRSFFDFAVSDTANPRDGFSEMHKVETTQTLPDGEKVWSDYPKIGFNADAFVVTVNMDLFSDPIGTNPDHGQIIVFDKSTLLDRNPDTLTYYTSNRPGPVYAPDPAPMHGSQPGDPLYFVQEVTRFGADSVDVIRMTNVLSANPTYTDTILPVTPYARPGRVVSPGNHTAETFESFFLNADWRDNHLVATQDIGVDGIVRARWYEFSTAGDQPSLTQEGDINQGDGVYTYFSAIAVAPNGDLGMTFEESSTTEYVSMYVTGQAVGDPPGMMEAPVASHPGAAIYTPSRAGDYSGVSVDPDSRRLFWAENLYKGADTAIWDTGIALFDVTSHNVVAVPKKNPQGTDNALAGQTLPQIADSSPSPSRGVVHAAEPATVWRAPSRADAAWTNAWNLDDYWAVSQSDARGSRAPQRPARPALLETKTRDDLGSDFAGALIL